MYSLKYFYALRPILACSWVLDQKSPPPVLFSRLAEAELPARLVPSVDDLLDKKMNGPEKMKIPPIREIDRYLDESMKEIAAEMERLPENTHRNWERLNQFFLDEIRR